GRVPPVAAGTGGFAAIQTPAPAFRDGVDRDWCARRRRGDRIAPLFAAVRLSAFGTKRRYRACLLLSAFGGKADIRRSLVIVAPSGCPRGRRRAAVNDLEGFRTGQYARASPGYSHALPNAAGHRPVDPVNAYIAWLTRIAL